MKRRYKRMGSCLRCGWCCLQEDCEHLSFDNDGLATCLIHEEERPLRCSLYPANPPIIHEGCGYWFLDSWEDNKIVKRKL